ncbi:MAG: nucleotidyltransferase family protein [Bacteroidales bacterium]|nr:nucleotidyltransferase family protein [Bacteroidales bacterium]
MMNENKITDSLFALIRGGLWGDASGFPGLDGDGWAVLAAESRRQAVQGLVCDGAKLLDAEKMPPREQSVDLLMESYTVEHRSAYVQEVFEALVALFRSRGLSPVVQKGPAVAQYYARPLARRSGDIDLFFTPEEFDYAAAVMEGEGVTLSPEPDGSICYRWRQVTVEHHRSYFDCRSRFEGVEVPSPEATMLLLSTHILKHAIGVGIGLKQLCDYAVACRALEGKYDREDYMRRIREAGLLRWQKMLDAFVCRYLGMPAESAPSHGLSKPSPNPERLLSIVLEGGDFGHYNSRRSLSGGGSVRKKNTVLFFLRRIPFALSVAPREWLHTVGRLIRGNLGH